MLDQPKMKHQVLSGGGASVATRPMMRASRSTTAAVPPAKDRPAAVSTRRAARVSGNSEEKKPDSELEALRREVERLRRCNEELEQQLAVAHHSVAQLRQQQQLVAAAACSSIPPPPPPPPTSRGIPQGQGVPVPPPPPPPKPNNNSSRRPPGLNASSSKATALVDMYKSLSLTTTTTTTNTATSSFVGELQNRSTHLLAIKADVESKAGLINHLITKVHQTTYSNVEQSDETAVLKHFSWPERKADALREATFEYRHLNSVLTQISKSDDITTLVSCEATLTKTSALQHKLEKSMARLVNLRSSAMPSYKELRIPTDWMLDSGIASKMRLASLKLAKVYMKRSLKELDRETGGEALLAQSVRFAYRVHQFAGGLDCEAMRLFEDLMQRAQLASSPP
uniref:Protein CHUP1, chloroplastic n=2 Tax=Leersia perrieri TaxID=77586 RepID=A0A0D9XN00_9ORYZ